MAQTTLSELTYNGQKVIVEVARRDALGRKIDTTYQTAGQVDTLIGTALTGYATRAWVQEQGYLKQHQDISGKLDVSTFNTWIGTTAPATYVAIDGFKADYLDANHVAYKSDIPSLTNYATQAWVNTQLESYAKTDSTYTKSQVDNLVTTLKKNSYQVVETKPTSGEEGITYLVGTAAPYEMWIWEGSAWIDLGSTSIDLSEYVPTSRKVNGKALTADITLTKTDVGLGSVANTGDSDTPVSGGTTKFTTGGAYTMQTNLNNAIGEKQDKLIAGANISISGTTISCTYSYTSPITATDVHIDLVP